MPLFNELLGGLMGAGGQGSSMQGALMGLLGNEGGAAGMAGGISGIVNAFEQAGLGHIVQSWVGNGPNQPVSPDQVQSALGEQRVQSMADQAGMGKDDFLAQLSQHLPHAVNQATPDGQVPDGQTPDGGSVSV